MIQNNQISGNSSKSGGGIFCFFSSSPTIQNNEISGNFASFEGGGIRCDVDSSPTITNNTITGNSAERDGGGIYCYDSSPTVLNTILWNDSPDEIYLSSSSITITYSDIQGGWGGEGNIDADPLFVDPENGDYHLQADSPCIDAGTPDGAPPDDLEGNPRDEAPDMGAYEFQGGRGAVNGTVTDKVTTNPIRWAIVIARLGETRAWAITNGDGYYEIADLEPGNWWAICIRRGYKPGIARVVVEAGETTTRDFELVPR